MFTHAYPCPFVSVLIHPHIFMHIHLFSEFRSFYKFVIVTHFSFLSQSDCDVVEFERCVLASLKIKSKFMFIHPDQVYSTQISPRFHPYVIIVPCIFHQYPSDIPQMVHARSIHISLIFHSVPCIFHQTSTNIPSMFHCIHPYCINITSTFHQYAINIPQMFPTYSICISSIFRRHSIPKFQKRKFNGPHSPSTFHPHSIHISPILHH